MATGAEPVQPPGWQLIAQWQTLIDAGDPRFTMLATVLDVAEPMARLESTIKVSMWNVQRHQTIYSMRDAAPVDAGMRRRRVDLRYILPRRVAERRCPLASSYDLGLRLAPVAHPLMVCDARWILVGDSTGETVWTSSDPGVVQAAVGFYDRLWRAAEPAVPEGQDPPFTRRMSTSRSCWSTGPRTARSPARRVCQSAPSPPTCAR